MSLIEIIDPLGAPVKFAPDREQRVWDASSLSAFLKCERFYNWNVREGWTSKHKDPATSWGSTVHYGLEVYDAARVEGHDLDSALGLAIRKMLADPHGLKESTETNRNLANAIRAVVWYVEQYRHDPIQTAVMPDGKPAIEIRFEIPIPNTDLRVSGRIDKIGWVQDQLFIVDRKTTKQTLGPWYFRGYAPDTQVYMYLWAAKRFLGMETSGFIIDAIQAAVGFNRFERSMIPVSSDNLDEFEANMVKTLERARTCHETGDWRPNFAACGNYGGCKYRDVCAKSPRLRETWLKADFERRPYKAADAYEVSEGE